MIFCWTCHPLFCNRLDVSFLVNFFSIIAHYRGLALSVLSLGGSSDLLFHLKNINEAFSVFYLDEEFIRSIIPGLDKHVNFIHP